ncbi:MAG: 16S rRNA (guanine(966)-N(2))-methyltransferase RsmD [Bacteroidales bacterium]
MRIVSGKFKGRQLYAPTDLPVRPTTDLAKESLFNILRFKLDLDEIEALDLFAGIGSISYELISRGALSVHAVDINPKCTAFIKETSERLKISNLQVFKQDAFLYPLQSKVSYDFIFADPPYQAEGIGTIPAHIFEGKVLKEQGLFVLEHSKEHNFASFPFFKEERHYGKVHFSFFSR